MPSSCRDLRDALAQCLSESPCVMAGHPAKDCLREPLASELPTRCQQLKKGYGDCKRGMIDMRKRFRGNKPLASTPTSSDADSEGSGKYIGGVGDGMLYASIGRKDSGVKKDVGWGAAEDEARGRNELVPDRFKDEGGVATSYFAGYTPPPENATVAKTEDKRPTTEREGAGWSWWRGS